MGYQRPRIEERVSHALAHGDLTPSENACDLDKIMAMGMVGVVEQMADAIYRLKFTNDARAYKPALQALLDISRGLNVRRNWRMGSKIELIAKEVLDYWIMDICVACTGKRDDPDGESLTAMPQIGTPYLEGVPCEVCRGTGKRPRPWVDIYADGKRNKLERCHNELLEAVEEAERRIRRQLIEKLSNPYMPG